MADILIIDFGSQYTHLIVTTLQYKIGVNSNLFPYTEITTEHIQRLNPKGIILSGGPQSVFDFPVLYAPHRLVPRCATLLRVER